ncbi:DUF3696 domain-containing protein [Vibrio splendidus]|jgi:predicted ATPase|uniref:DUF3696 domain-containing protein n=1 Tax=Vibrio splendidus TaxID=29497 RepID=UPI001F52E074|nr:DUF3696 domain-containing protein [Vibrio splendidus]
MTIINKVELENFKSYKKEYFELNKLTVFCGNNSVGKSTAIQSLGILLQSQFSKFVDLNGELVHLGNVDDIHNYFNREEDSLSISVTGQDGNKYVWGYENGAERDSARISNKLSMSGEYSNYYFLQSELKNSRFQFIEAERYGPRDNLDLADSKPHPYWLGTKGEYTVEVLNNLIDKQPKQLSGLDTDPRKNKSVSRNDVFKHIEAWMGEISPGYTLEPSKIEQANVTYNSITPKYGQATKPINIGFGYSYALSIVSALLIADPNDIIIIENPEAHLHPRGQSFIGRLIALTAKAGVQVIVETHSDHLLNGIRVTAKMDDGFDPSIFNLYYISQGDEQSAVDRIKLTSDGKLSSWPEGFFDQQARDMFTIMTGKSEMPS